MDVLSKRAPRSGTATQCAMAVAVHRTRVVLNTLTLYHVQTPTQIALYILNVDTIPRFSLGRSVICVSANDTGHLSLKLHVI
eukprot:4383952-Pleurochrysis_carterae.AAC.1